MLESTGAQPKSELEAGHIAAYAHPLDDPAAAKGRSQGILFLVILAIVAILGFAGFLYRVFSAD
jgi:hypothetical protein